MSEINNLMKLKITKFLWAFFFTINMNNIMNAQVKKSNGFTYLNDHQQNLSAISALTASGDTENLSKVLNSGLDSGLAINEIKEALVQLYAYCGFPRSLNALGVFKMVVEERAAKGIKDKEGKKITLENASQDKYEQGRKVLEELTRTPQQKPAPGFGEFAPRADAFLKEHLFADIFNSDVLNFRQREFVTISALAAMPGVEPQLKAHIGMGKNTGITDEQLKELALIIDQYISRQQGNVLRNAIGEKELPLIASDMMVRISEIEIVPEFLDRYKSILEEESAASVRIEPGVIAIFPMFQKKNPNQVRIVEIYADKKAYESHLKAPHFKEYKESTLSMIKSLKLVDMNVLDTKTMMTIFSKLNNRREDGNSQSTVSAFPVGKENTDLSKYFIGKSYVASLTSNKELNLPIANVTFEPGCRNNWHKHTSGQILIVVGGEGLFQERGKKSRRIKEGDIIEIGPDVEHWHGATKNSWFAHLSIMPDHESNKNTWMEAVNEEVYETANKE